MDGNLKNTKTIEVKLSKVYKKTVDNEKKLKTYLHERYFNSAKRISK